MAAMQDCYLAYYLTELAGATFMIFTRTCDNTRKMALMLRNLGFDAIPIHGQMAQAKRIGALNKFKAGERSILCATGWALTCCADDTQVGPCMLCKQHLQQQRNARGQERTCHENICCLLKSCQLMKRRQQNISATGIMRCWSRIPSVPLAVHTTL